MAPISVRAVHQLESSPTSSNLELTGATLLAIRIHTANHTLLRISTGIRNSDRLITRSATRDAAGGDGYCARRDDC